MPQMTIWNLDECTVFISVFHSLFCQSFGVLVGREGTSMSQETLVSGKNNSVNKCVKGKKFREVLIMKFKTIIDI